MTPALLLLPLGALLLSRSKPKRRLGLRHPEEGTFRPQIIIVDDCHAWSIPDSWWEFIALPRYAELVESGEREVAHITYALLNDEVGTCVLPPSLEVQVDLPDSENYWGGSPQMLYLAQHVAEVVLGGLTVLEETGKVTLSILELDKDVVE